LALKLSNYANKLQCRASLSYRILCEENYAAFCVTATSFMLMTSRYSMTANCQPF